MRRAASWKLLTLQVVVLQFIALCLVMAALYLSGKY
jgi:hypothetical protein